MVQTTAELLALTSEAAVLVQAGRIAYANSAALAALGQGCVGKRAADLFGDLVTGAQGSAFLAQIRIGETPYLVRVSRIEKNLLFFLQSQAELPPVLNQPFLYALRSSLMNMELSCEQLRGAAEDLQNESMLHDLRIVTRSQYRILRMLNNAALILNLADNSVVCTPRSFNFSGLCASILDAVEEMMPGLRIQRSLGNAIEICADPALVKTLLMNLLSNAIVHGHGASRIAVSLLEAEHSIVLAVDDDGCGIPAEELYQIFDRYRHGYELSQMSAGPGLGLTAARLIAQLHNGTLLLESRAGSGTTLRVSLSRENAGSMALHSGDEPVFCQAKDVLTGLADCLPLDCFSERYLD